MPTPKEALHNAINAAIAAGNPIITEIPARTGCRIDGGLCDWCFYYGGGECDGHATVEEMTRHIPCDE